MSTGKTSTVVIVPPSRRLWLAFVVALSGFRG
jgi:hypothetical protein